MAIIDNWYGSYQFSKTDTEEYYKTSVFVNTRKFPHIVVNDNNEYQIIFAIDKEHAEWIAENDFDFHNAIALSYESIENFKDAKAALALITCNRKTGELSNG